jgi:dTDP-glucose 4,6-dehydratase
MHTYPEMNISMTHCANNYGPYQFPEKLIPLVVVNVLRGRKAPVYGDGEQRRDWVHVLDHCRAIHAVMDQPKRPMPPEAATDPSLLPIYDISARNEVSNLEVVRRVLEALDVRPEDWIEHVPDRPNHDRRYLINPEKIERELGWAPTVSFEEGLRETVKWYVENESWWQSILARTGDLQFAWDSKTPGRGGE